MLKEANIPRLMLRGKKKSKTQLAGLFATDTNPKIFYMET